MASTWPTTADSFATNKTDSTVMATDHKNHHNDLADAVNKIEASIGAGITNGRLKVVQESPLNPKWPEYGAVGDDSTDDFAAIQAWATAVAGTSGGRGYLPPGTYRMNDELEIPGTNAPVFEGGGREKTSLKWVTDIGANKLAVKWMASPSEQSYRVLSHMAFEGPGQGAGFGLTSNVNMGGVQMASRVLVDNCNSSGFHSGYIYSPFGTDSTTSFDHNKLRDSNAGGNLYGVFFGSGAVNIGDHIIDNVGLTFQRLASLGIGTGGRMAGFHWRDGHMGECPVAIFIEDQSTFDIGRVLGGVFQRVSVEAIGNAWVYDKGYVDAGFAAADQNKIEEVTFINFGGTDFGHTDYDLASLSYEACFMIEQLQNCHFVGMAVPFGTAANHAFRCLNMTRTDLGPVGQHVEDNNNSKRYLNIGSTLHRVGGTYFDARVRPHKVSAGVSAVSRYDILKTSGSSNQEVAQQGQGSAYGLPYGVALESGSAGQTILAVREGAHNVKTGGNSVAAGDVVIIDQTASATGKTGALTDARVIGQARSGSSGGFTSTELMFS